MLAQISQNRFHYQIYLFMTTWEKDWKVNTIIFIKINKEALDIVEVTKCLGVLIDDKLMWKNHVSLVKSKLSKCCAIMYRASIMIDRCGLGVLTDVAWLY